MRPGWHRGCDAAYAQAHLRKRCRRPRVFRTDHSRDARPCLAERDAGLCAYRPGAEARCPAYVRPDRAVNRLVSRSTKRSEERRIGKERIMTGTYRWSQNRKKTK